MQLAGLQDQRIGSPERMALCNAGPFAWMIRNAFVEKGFPRRAWRKASVQASLMFGAGGDRSNGRDGHDVPPKDLVRRVRVTQHATMSAADV